MNDVYSRQVWWVSVQSTWCRIVWPGQSDIIRQQTSTLYVQHTQLVARCLCKIHKICCLSKLTRYHFTTLPTLPTECRLPPTHVWNRIQQTRYTLITGVGYGQNLPYQKARQLGVQEESSRDTRHISFNNGKVPGKTGRRGTPIFIFYFLWNDNANCI